MAGRDDRERIFAMLERARDTDIRRWGLLTAAIRRLEALWAKRKRQAGLILVYGFRGEVKDRGGSITADVIIAYEAWSGAVRTDVQAIDAAAQRVAIFIATIREAFPAEYRGFIKMVKIMPSQIELSLPSFAKYLRDHDDDRDDFEFQISRAWHPVHAGMLTHNGATTLVQLRRELLEWERVHNCETRSSPSQGVCGGDSGNAHAADVRAACSQISIKDALQGPAIMRHLTKITDPFAPVRRIEFAVYQQSSVDSGDVPITSSDVARLLTRSKANQQTRISWKRVGSDGAAELIGRAIALARKKNSLTQAGAARMLGVKQQQISRLEKNPTTASQNFIDNVLSRYGEYIEDLLPLLSIDDEAAKAVLNWLDETEN